jgi:hypothetical protein
MLSVTFALAGCATSGIGTTSEAQCAGRQPIEYTSTKKDSQFYAAPGLAKRLAVENQTGVNLKCKAFQ